MRKFLPVLFVCVCLTAYAQFQGLRDNRVPAIQSDTTSLESFLTSSSADISTIASDIDRAENNVFANALRIGSNYDLIIYDMDDGFVDAYTDQTGIDLGAGSNYTYNATNYYEYNDTVTLALSAQPTAHYKLNDAGIDTVVADAMGSYNGVLIGGNVTTDLDQAGKINGSLLFDGANDYVLCSSLATAISPILTNYTKVSFACWVDFTDDGDDDILFAEAENASSGGKQQHLYLYHTAGGVFSVQAMNDGLTNIIEVTGSTSISASDGWNHVGFSLDLDSGICTLYVNGLQDGQVTGIGDIGDFSACSKIAVAGAEHSFKLYPTTGALDDARIWAGTALTSADFLLLYNGGDGTEGTLDTASGGTMELISTNGYNATSAPTESRLMVLHEEVAGTPTLNTDIKAWSSSDNGSTWDQVTLGSIGELSSGVDMLVGTNALTGASTNMKYRVTTHSSTNQGRFHGASILWK